MGFGLFIFFVCTQVVAVLAKAPILSLVLAIGAFLWGYQLMQKQGEMQEFEADVVALKILGISETSVTAATAALEKLDQFNLKFIQPTTEKRVLFMKSMLAAYDSTNQNNDQDSGRKAA